MSARGSGVELMTPFHTDVWTCEVWYETTLRLVRCPQFQAPEGGAGLFAIMYTGAQDDDGLGHQTI
jgi:hypothetical protein